MADNRRRSLQLGGVESFCNNMVQKRIKKKSAFWLGHSGGLSSYQWSLKLPTVWKQWSVSGRGAKQTTAQHTYIKWMSPREAQMYLKSLHVFFSISIKYFASSQTSVHAWLKSKIWPHMITTSTLSAVLCRENSHGANGWKRSIGQRLWDS